MNGLNDTEGRLRTPGTLSADRKDDLEPWAERRIGNIFCGEESDGDGEFSSLAARKADNGLELARGSIWWKVDMLP